MIGTVELKAKRYEGFTIEARVPNPAVILVMGSCRTVPYLNYLLRYNRMTGYPFRLHYIDPFNFHWNEREELVDIEPELAKQEGNARIRHILETTQVFIHEWYENYGMFNTNRHGEKHVYQFGMQPTLDISIPNYDRAILFRDAMPGVDNPTPEQLDEWKQRGNEAVESFCQMCAVTSFPKFGDYFRDHWRKVRLFWTINHVSAAFTTKIFRMMTEQFGFLGRIDQPFLDAIAAEDMYDSHQTPVTQYDRDAYGLQWP